MQQEKPVIRYATWMTGLDGIGQDMSLPSSLILAPRPVACSDTQQLLAYN